MSIRSRPMRAEDVEECVRFTAANPVLRSRYGTAISQLAQTWLSLIGRDCFIAIIVEETGRSARRMLAVCAAAFVTDDFVEELEAPPSFWIAAELVARFGRGRPTFLSDNEVRRANSTTGLHLVGWQNGVPPGEWRRPEVAHALMGVFLENLRGFRLNVICLQAESVERLFAMQGSGVKWFDLASRRWTDIPLGKADDVLREPHVAGLKPESLTDRASYAGLTFLYQPPLFGFSRSEQRLLLAALDGASDQDLSDELGTSLFAVKGTWRRVYERVAEHGSGLLPEPVSPRSGIATERGKEKRRRLIFYLREHPEELRPVSLKLLRSAEGRAWPGLTREAKSAEAASV